MTDIVDAFVVSLGIDASQYNREIKNYRDDRKRLGEEEKRANQTTEDSQKRLTAGFRTLRNEAAGFLLVLAGANSVKQFVGNILTGDAAVGRLAKNLGVATESLSAWQGAVREAGGTSGDADNAFRSINAAMQNRVLTGDTSKDADFLGVGVNIAKKQTPEEVLLQISEASSRMSRPQFGARLGRLGFDESTITLLAKGRPELEKVLEIQRKQAAVTEEQAAAAAAFQTQLVRLENSIKGAFRPEIEKVVGVLATWLENGENLNIVTNASIGLVGALGIAAGVAYAPFVLLAGAIAVFASNLDTSNYAMARWAKTWSGVKKLMNGDFSGAGSDLWEEFKTEAQDTLDEVNEFAGLPDNNGRAGRLAERAGMSSGEAAFTRMNGGRDAMGNMTGGAASAGGGGRDAATVERYFKARGYTAAQARGIAASVVAEGGLTQRTGGGYRGRALGIGQLLGSRRADFLKKYGNNFTLQNELDFMHAELQGGDPGGAAVLAQTSAGGTLNAMVNSFYRPKAGAQTIGDLQRGNAWLNGGGTSMASRGGGAAGGTVNQTTTIGQVVIHTAVTDAEGVARDMRGALAKRGLVAQANTGLTG